MHWPNRNPYNKRWFQLQCARRLTSERCARVQDMVLRWEPRLWAAGVNVPPRLLVESRRLGFLVANGMSDWGAFPAWVRRNAGMGGAE